jgi:hypothetical protein
MYRALILLVFVVACDAKRAPPTRAPAAVQPLPPPRPAIRPTPVPVLEVEEALPDEDDESVGIDVDVALENARVATSGAVQGTIRESSTGEMLPGATVVVTSPALLGEQVAITDENGFFRITGLPEGTYLTTIYYIDARVEYSNVGVYAGKTTPVYQSIDPNAGVVRIEERGQGIVIDNTYVKNIPVPGRTFESTLGAAAGEQDEGISFSGSELSENTYIVDEIIY